MKTKPIQDRSLARADGVVSALVVAPVRPQVKSRSGVALLIVLGMLVLLSVIVLAFVTSVTTDLADSKGYEGQVTTKMLADSVLDLVEMEIRAASTGTANGANVAWISQPGLLRTYDNNGNAVAAYKLYSANQMVVAGTFDPNAGTDLPSSTGTGWLNQPNLWTDLNSPLAVPSGSTTSSGSTIYNYIFPIIDGNGIRNITLNGSSQLTYSTTGTTATVEGFSTLPTQVGLTYSGSAYSGTEASNPVPMPVQWLYMLKDGTLIPATASGNSKDVQFNGTIVPTGTNPIVARVAFWTDDESCKVNINTSSEGTFWDTPVCNTQPNVSDAGEPDDHGEGNPADIFDPNQIFEWDLAQRQPDRNEYQRYPGHPATTCMSPVIGDTLYNNLNLSTYANTGTGIGYHCLSGSGWSTFTEVINQLAPRISGMDASSAVTSYPSGTNDDFSSRGGTHRPGGTGVFSAATTTNVQWMNTGSDITPDQNPLYATVDDYFFTGTLPGTNSRVYNGWFLTGTGNGSGTTATYSAPGIGTIIQPVLPPSFVEKARFFLTANSNAPELNVFNMPRVCIWPITKNPTVINNPIIAQVIASGSTLTSFDKVIAFDATVGGQNSGTCVPFYFSRSDPFSQTFDYANSSNNQNLYTYLHTLMGKPFPGLSASGGATFVNKYSTEDTGNANQILTEIYDYIRCTNLMDESEDQYGSTPYGTKSYTMVNSQWAWCDPQWYSQTSQGQVVPILIGSTRGIGRYAIPGEMSLFMLQMNPGTDTSNQIIVTQGPYKGTWTIKTPAAFNGNVLLGSGPPSNAIYSGSPTSPPTNDYPLVPGAGGFARAAGSSGTQSGTYNTYDPRYQTKVQIALLPYYFSPMAGYCALSNNIRYHWSNVSISAVATNPPPQAPSSLTGTVAVTPGPAPSGTYLSGTQGQDLYDFGRIDTINQMEEKIAGPMGPKSLIDPSTSTALPSNLGAPPDSMCQVLEVIVNGTSSPAFTGSGSNTMTISGSATLQIIAPGLPLNSGSYAYASSWLALRGLTDGTAAIQTINFSWPKTTVQIPSIGSALWVAQQGTSSTLCNSTSSQESAIISATTAGGTNVKTTTPSGSSRLYATPYGDQNGGNYNDIMVSSGPQDVVRSLPLSGTMQNSGIGIQGDFRLVAATGTVPSTWYQPVQKYPLTVTGMSLASSSFSGNSLMSGTLTPYYNQTIQYAYGWRTCITQGGGVWPNSWPPGYLFGNVAGTSGSFPVYNNQAFAPYMPCGVMGVYNYLNSPGDWDNGAGWITDGAYCNKPDEGWIRHYEAQQDFVASSVAPFIGHSWAEEDAALGIPSLYAPNKMISSAVMFGSLPTGVMAQHPWETLLFRPAKPYLPGGASGATSGSPVHPGAAVGGNGGLSPGTGVLPYPPYSTLPDHALLDLFWMPVVDPWPISEPFATAGRVNLNYQIAPFTYITRNTALRAVLQSVKITAMNPTEVDKLGNQLSNDYKQPGSYGNNSSGIIGSGGGLGVCVRRNIDLEDTIKQIDYLRFGLPKGIGTSVNKPFITASEICDIPLIPDDLPTNVVANYNIRSQIQGAQPSGYDTILAGFWYGGGSGPTFGHRLTGDNSLERPYSMIYPRLTTKSNVFTVHVRVEALRKSNTTPPAVFKDGIDQVVGEFRGSFVIERYLDPTTAGFYTNGNVNLPTTINGPNAQLGPYKFRIVSTKQFGQ